MDAMLERLAALPPLLLYLAMTIVAAFENFFPPIPADVIVAFGSFLAARQGASPIPAYASVVIGNVGGAVLMYFLGRRYGTGLLARRLHVKEDGPSMQRLRRLYGAYGLPALFFSRFIPGVRALVPPFAGALRVPVFSAIAAIGLASALFYGVVTYFAFRVASSWEQLSAKLAQFGKVSAIAAAAVVALGVFVWVLRRRRTA